MPSFFGPRRTAAIAALFACAAFLSSCNELMNPCNGRKDLSGYELNLLYLDGEYPLTQVEGKALPATGYVIPFSGGEKLRSGTLTFYTFRLDSGSCEAPDETSGEVIALYKLVKPDGSAEPTKTQSGSFSYNYKTNKLTLRALGEEASTVVDNVILGHPVGFPLSAPIPVPVLGTVTFKLRFGK